MSMGEDGITEEATLQQGMMADTLFDAVASSNMAHTLASVEGDRPLIYVNQAFLDETGYTHEEVIGRNCRFLQGKDTDPAALSYMKRELDAYRPVDVEILNYRKDGSPFLNRLRVSTVFDKQGKPLAYMGIQSNINTLVETVRVTQEKYRMESLGRLSANVSHEIKNALQPIRLMLETLQEVDQLSGEQIKHCVSIAMENMDIAEHVVHDVLHYSKDTGAAKQVLKANALLHAMTRFMRNLLPKSAALDVHIDKALQASGACLKVNQNNILAVATNLVHNALDATNQQGALDFIAAPLHIPDAHNLPLNPGYYLSIALCDSGTGIEASVLESIFDPFFSTKSPGKGTGLGLALCMKIAKEHGGIITADNRPEGGARFTLYLPLLSNSA